MRKRAFVSLVFTAALVLIAANTSTAAAADGPIIDEVESRAAFTSARVTWTTDITSTGKVEYGTNPGEYNANVETEEGTEHNAVLPDLAEETTYYFRITATDGDDNTTMSAELSITTLNSKLRITKLEVLAHAATKAILHVDTNKRAYTSVHYGASPDALTGLAERFELRGPSGSMTDIYLIKNLKPNTVYYYQAVAEITEFLDPDDVSLAKSGIGLFQTDGRAKITRISPTRGRKGASVTITGTNFGEDIRTQSKNKVRNAVAFGCTLTRWPAKTPSCLGTIVSWTDTKIVVKVPKGAKTGYVYVGKGAYEWPTSVQLFVARGPVFTVLGVGASSVRR